MKPANSERSFRRFIAQGGAELDNLSPARALELTTTFYATQRVAGAYLHDDGDMLLFHWGTYAIDGRLQFRFHLTRQFVWASRVERFVRLRLLRWESADITTMTQLHLTLSFAPVAELAELGTGNYWCHHPDDVLQFREKVVSSAPYLRLAELRLTPRVELHFERV